MKNRNTALQVLVSFILVLSLILPASVVGASVALHRPDDHPTTSLAVDSYSDASAVPQGRAASMVAGDVDIEPVDSNQGETDGVQLSLKAGWNLVSVPVVPDDISVESVFAGTEVVYAWNATAAGYYMPTEVEPLRGYWVAVMSDMVITVSGTPVYSWTADINAGWNLIGSVYQSVNFTSPDTEPPGKVEPFSFRWDPDTGYSYETTTEPGMGHWIAATDACILTLTAAEEPVHFPDPNLEAAIREAINKPTGPIHPSDLEGLTYLDAQEINISDLTGLEHCTSLTVLYLYGNQISDISPLAGLASLTVLYIWRNQISDISPIAGLTSLTGLHLWFNQISDVSSLAGLTGLIGLSLGWNQISDISPLAGLTSLYWLDLSRNQISDISPLAGLTSLTGLSLAQNQISDISPLAGLTSLTDLPLSGNQISDISPLAGLTSLTQLWLHSNQISDISPLASLTSLTYLSLYSNQISDVSSLAGLTSLTQLWLHSNQISDISPLASLSSLTFLELGGNQISDISPLAGLTSLTHLSLYSNQITDISPLASLTSLTDLWLGDNQIGDIKPLVDNPGLGEGDSVDLRNNPLSDESINEHIPALQARGVTVYYDEEPGKVYLIVSSTAGGSVTTPGEDAFTYDYGTVVDLVAEAEEGYQFVNWTGDVHTIADAEAAETTITVEGDYSITAVFDANEPPWCTITVHPWDYTTPFEDIVDQGGSWHSSGFTRHIYAYDPDGTVVSYDYFVYDNIGHTVISSGTGDVSWDGSYYWVASQTFTVGEDGDFSVQGKNASTLYVRVTDNEGAVSEWATVTYNIDWTPPSVGIVSPTTATAGVPEVFSATVSDNVELNYAFLYVDGSYVGSMTLDPSPVPGGESGTVSMEYAFALPGTYTMYVRCADHYDPESETYLNLVSGSPVAVEVSEATDPEVTLPDANLEAAIREAIGIPGRALYPSDLKGLTLLDASNRGVSDLTGLEHCTGLIQLGLGDNQISDISPLTGLTNLMDLYIGANQIVDISPLADLTNLTCLDLTHNQISDITPLVDNPGLGTVNYVYLRYNYLDLTPGSQAMDDIQALQARGVEVHYDPQTEIPYALTISSTAGGSVTTPGEGVFVYPHGEVVDLVATPAGGYQFVNWTGNVGTIANVNAAETTITMNDGYSINANFAPGYAPMVAAGGGRTVGLKSDGTVVALGWNPYGQCDVGGWTDIVQVAAGGWHTVGLESDGTVVAVGSNTSPQCDVSGWTDIVQVAAGGEHTVGLKSDGTVVAAGPEDEERGDYRQCDVGGWTDIVQVAAGAYHTVGLKSDGTAMALGGNWHGECDVGGWTDIVQVAAGGTAGVTPHAHHTVGLKSDGTVVAVGNNHHGQCDVDGWGGIVQVAAGGKHTVGLKSDGTVVAVGNNWHGELNVGGWTDVVQVAAGAYHTVGLKSDGTVVAVGSNYYGQCDVGGWMDIVQISALGYNTVGLKSDGTVMAGGWNYYGQCDVGEWTDIVQVATGWYHTVGLESGGTVVAVGKNNHGQCDVGDLTDIVQVGAGGRHTVGLDSDGTVVAMGHNGYGQCDVGGWTDIIQVAAGGWHTVGLMSDGTVVAVGDGRSGQCDVGAWTDIVQMAAGSHHTVGLKSDGTVVAVGWNHHGQLDVDGWTDIVQMAAGSHHTVGLKSDGTVLAVGLNWYGQCNVEDWTGTMQVATGSNHTVGLESDGTVVAAGAAVELAKWNLVDAVP